MNDIRFIHIPKNAGTSIYKFLTDNNISFLYGTSSKKIVHFHRPASFFANEDSFKFAIIRNPYTRLVSYYNYMVTKDWNPSFENFVKNKLINKKTKIPTPWKCQIEWLYSDGKRIVDKVFKFENINDELPNFFGIKSIIGHQNRSTYNEYEEYYNPELKKIVYEQFIEDFNLLEY